jgi:hypothetical protein
MSAVSTRLKPSTPLFVRVALAALLAAPAFLLAAYDPPAGYYSSAIGVNGSTLKTALHNRIKGHLVLSYTPGVWDALEALDQDPDNSANVTLLYSGISGDSADPDGDGIPNRVEFLLNRRPLISDFGGNGPTTLVILPAPVTGGASVLSLTHRRHRYATDLTLRYEATEDCSQWTEFAPSSTLTVYVDALTDLARIETPLSTARRFLRLKVDRL